MLILSRRPGDAILIDGGIRIVVLASGQRSVRLGIEAPAQIGIVREEIADRPQKGDVPAADAQPQPALPRDQRPRRPGAARIQQKSPGPPPGEG
jgi:carbon storage regulator